MAVVSSNTSLPETRPIPRGRGGANPSAPAQSSPTAKATVSTAATGSHLHTSMAKLKHAIGGHFSKSQLSAMFDKAAKKFHVPANLLKAVAYHESGWDPRAKSYDGHHGKGVMQIDDRSHKFAKTPAVWNPAENIDYGARLLSDLHQEAGG